MTFKEVNNYDNISVDLIGKWPEPSVTRENLILPAEHLYTYCIFLIIIVCIIFCVLRINKKNSAL